MMRTRFTKEQIIGMRQECEASGTLREVCRVRDLTAPTLDRGQRLRGGRQRVSGQE